MASQITVPFEIMWDSGITEANPTDGAQAKMKFRCLWSDHYQLVKDLMWGGLQAGKSIVRIGPLPYPPSPNLWCKAIESVEPIGPPTPTGMTSGSGHQVVTGRYAIVTAVFAYCPWISDPVTAQPFTQTSVGVSGEVLCLPGKTYTVGGVATSDPPLGVIIPQMEIVFKRFFMPYLPLAEMTTLAGHVNSDSFVCGDATFTAGYLLFLGGNSEYASDTTGKITMTVDYKFMWRAISWNSAFIPGSGSAGYAAVGAISPAPYPTAVFTGALP